MPGGKSAGSYPPCHVVLPENFDDLAAGGGGPKVLDVLASGERSRRLMLLRAMLDGAAKEANACGPLPSVETAWNMLIAVQNRAPAEFDKLLMHPQTGMWLAHSLRRLHRVTESPAVPLWVDIGYLYNIVLAVAARAGIEMLVTVPHRGGTVMIPTLGMARFGQGMACGVVQASVNSGHMCLRTAHDVVNVRLPGTADSDGWWTLRRIGSQSGENEVVVWLDDIDPYREIGEPVPPERLSHAQTRQWRHLLNGAYEILTRDNPRLASAVAMGLTSVVPLPPSPDLVRSASSGDSSGSALISMPPDPTALAVTLVHEFQHIKLGGLLHLLKLCRDDSSPRLYAPWRDDPRPLSGLLQGVYAFLGVTEFWRLHRSSCSSARQRAFAEFEFALWREQTWHALQSLHADAGLTKLGRRFAAGMATTMRRWWVEAVDQHIAAAAQLAVQDHRAGWRVRHLQTDSAYIAKLARDFSQGHTARIDDWPTPRMVPDLGVSWTHQRIALARLRLTAPDEFHRLSSRNAAHHGHHPGDVALVSGNYRIAANAYARQLAADPDQPDAWVGLALAVSAENRGGRSLLECPELMPALHRKLRSSHGRGSRADQAIPDPRAIAEWLCGISLSAFACRSTAYNGIGAMSASARKPLVAAMVAGCESPNTCRSLSIVSARNISPSLVLPVAR